MLLKFPSPKVKINSQIFTEWLFCFKALSFDVPIVDTYRYINKIESLAVTFNKNALSSTFIICRRWNAKWSYIYIYLHFIYIYIYWRKHYGWLASALFHFNYEISNWSHNLACAWISQLRNKSHFLNEFKSVNR